MAKEMGEGLKKVAKFLVAMGPEHASKVLRVMKPGEVEILTLEMSRVSTLSGDERLRVLEEFYDVIVAKNALYEGGLDYAHDVLVKSFGEEKANLLIKKLEQELESRPLSVARRINAGQLLSYIINEHNQIKAVVMAHVSPVKAAEIMEALSPNDQKDVARRLAMMGKVSPEFVAQIEEILTKKKSNYSQSESAEVGGAKGLAEIINRVDRSSERSILDYFDKSNPDLADEVRQYLFTFEDIPSSLNATAIREVISGLKNADIALALKGASEEIRESIFSGVSERQKELILEELDMLGPVPKKDVEGAQKLIVSEVRRLEEEGTIAISRDGEEMI